MHESDPNNSVVNGRPICGGISDHQVSLSDKNQVRMMNVVPQPFADDEPQGTERLLAQTGLNLFGTEHKTASDFAVIIGSAGDGRHSTTAKTHGGSPRL